MNSILVMFTWNGDVTMDGKIGADGYYQMDSGCLEFFTTHGKTSCRRGDVDFNDCVNADDHYLIDSAYLGALRAGRAPMAERAGPFGKVALRGKAVRKLWSKKTGRA